MPWFIKQADTNYEGASSQLILDYCDIKLLINHWPRCVSQLTKLRLQSDELTRCLAPAVTGSRCRCCLGNRECTPLCSRLHRCRPPGVEPAEAHEPICRTWTPTLPAHLPPPRCAPSACCASPACNKNRSPSYLDPETLIWDPWEVRSLSDVWLCSEVPTTAPVAMTFQLFTKPHIGSP